MECQNLIMLDRMLENMSGKMSELLSENFRIYESMSDIVLDRSQNLC